MPLFVALVVLALPWLTVLLTMKECNIPTVDLRLLFKAEAMACLFLVILLAAHLALNWVAAK